MSDKIDELIDDIVTAAGDRAGAYEWGTGTARYEREIIEARAAIHAAFSELQQRIAALEATKGDTLERIVKQVENGR